ncbi:MAG: hypothetical protein Ta2D_08330 [Rickettsiales bacterium]|nr:MAG: hypothetical protein Ta2D_08330 [Rickettsiales bacterium]
MEFVKKNGFKISILLICFVIFGAFGFKGHFKNEEKPLIEGVAELEVYVQDGCIHCMNAEEWLKTDPFGDKVNVVYYNLKDRKNVDILLKKADKLGINKNEIGTPIFIIGGDYKMGFSEDIKKTVTNWVNNKYSKK